MNQPRRVLDKPLAVLVTEQDARDMETEDSFPADREQFLPNELVGLPPEPEGEHQPLSTQPRIPLIAFDQIVLGRERRYLVKGLIPRVGLAVVWGPPKCGKSFWTFDVMMHVALGWAYRGRRVHGGPVVYCAFEGQSGFQARKAAFEQRFLAEERELVPFYLVPVTLDLVREQDALIHAIRAHLGDAKPVAVALDTLNRSLRGSESSDEDMSAYVNAAGAIKRVFPAQSKVWS